MSRRKQGIPKKSDGADEEVNGDKLEQGGHSLLFISAVTLWPSERHMSVFDAFLPQPAAGYSFHFCHTEAERKVQILR